MAEKQFSITEKLCKQKALELITKFGVTNEETGQKSITMGLFGKEQHELSNYNGQMFLVHRNQKKGGTHESVKYGFGLPEQFYSDETQMNRRRAAFGILLTMEKHLDPQMPLRR